MASLTGSEDGVFANRSGIMKQLRAPSPYSIWLNGFFSRMRKCWSSMTAISFVAAIKTCPKESREPHRRSDITQSFASTRQGYRQMLAWMRSFGEVQRVGVESTGSYGAGLLRFLQQAGSAVLEVTTPDRQDRRRRGKNDDFDALDRF